MIKITCHILVEKMFLIKHLNYSECGFLIFNTEHPIHEKFWQNMMKMYDDGDLFSEQEWHDSYII